LAPTEASLLLYLLIDQIQFNGVSAKGGCWRAAGEEIEISFIRRPALTSKELQGLP
jgi:hypothetical protein